MSEPIKGEEKEEERRMKDRRSELHEGREQSSISSEQETTADKTQNPRTQGSDSPEDRFNNLHEGREQSSISSEQETKANKTQNPRTQGSDLPEDRFNILRTTGRRDLYVAALTGDWQFATLVLGYNPALSNRPLTYREDTALHVATSVKGTAFVTEMLRLLNSDDLEIQNKDGNTAFCLAAISGDVRIANMMLARNKKLLYIHGQNKMLPIHMATSTGQREMVLYLFRMMNFNELKDPHPDVADPHPDVANLFLMSISSSMYGISFELLRKYPTLATARDREGLSPMHLLARKPSEELEMVRREEISGHELVQSLWDKVLLLEDKEVKDLIMTPSGILIDAAKSGNVVFLKLVLQFNPYLIMEADSHERNVLHIAVLNRKESIYRLLNNLGVAKDLIVNAVDKEGNNVLHFAGKLEERTEKFVTLPPNLQMQKELLWFKEVEKIVPTSCKTMRNKQDMTPRDLFYSDHKTLFKESESAVKETANQAMVVATLITTVVFAAALTVPGANNSGAQSKTPIFSRDCWYIIYILSNAIALFFSSAAIILLLSIISSRITENQVFGSLQESLMFAFTTLFISITSMVIAFTAASFLIFDMKKAWVAYLITSLSSIPVVLYVVVHYKLWADFIRSYYWSKNLFKIRGSKFTS